MRMSSSADNRISNLNPKAPSSIPDSIHNQVTVIQNNHYQPKWPLFQSQLQNRMQMIPLNENRISNLNPHAPSFIPIFIQNKVNKNSTWTVLKSKFWTSKELDRLKISPITVNDRLFWCKWSLRFSMIGVARLRCFFRSKQYIILKVMCHQHVVLIRLLVRIKSKWNWFVYHI